MKILYFDILYILSYRINMSFNSYEGTGLNKVIQGLRISLLLMKDKYILAVIENTVEIHQTYNTRIYLMSIINGMSCYCLATFLKRILP